MENPNLRQIKYSIIILIYHREDWMVEMGMDCVRSVLNTVNKDECEVILVDNGSTVRHDWDKYVDTYVRLDKNYGISRGWNTGLRLSKGTYKVVLGDDVKVRGNWLEGLQKAMDMPNCGVANIHVEHLPPGIGIQETYKWFSGACFMLTQNTIDKVGYFDEKIFPANTEDWQYWIRTHQKGLKLYRNFSHSVQHKEGQTVHAKDISKEHSRLLDNLKKEFGFDPVPVFCGDKDMPLLQTS